MHPDTAASSHRGLLGPLLRDVSRSFYLTLRVLPASLRVPVGLAYLLARAADTIADTQLLPPPHRLQLLLAFRAQVAGPAEDARLREIEAALTAHQQDSSERLLLQSLVPAVRLLDKLSEADRGEVRAVVTTLTRGMEMDLATFPLENSGKVAALRNMEELDRYIFLVAGCVGEFWTRITLAHTPALGGWDAAEMCARGVRFGKALQLTNVLRDCPRDLRIGRCYFPSDKLAQVGLRPEDLLKAENSARARPILRELLLVALDHYREALRYTLAIPRRCVRLRLACLWPVLIGLPTLGQLARRPDWLEPGRPARVAQGFVNRMLVLSVPGVLSNAVVERWVGWHLGCVEEALRSES